MRNYRLDVELEIQADQSNTLAAVVPPSIKSYK